MKINIFGDFVPIEKGVFAVSNGTAIDSGIISYIREVDYNIVNLECPVFKGDNVKGILKDGPCMKTGVDSVRYLKDCGFDMVTLANNHLKDFGEEGIRDTFNACEEFGIEWVGAGKNLNDARKPKVIEKNGIKIGVVNVCENESSIATDKEPGANPIDEINNYYDICQLKQDVDIIIVIIHGGSEHYHYPTPRMKKRCNFYADLGVSAIVCHHIHCYSGYEVYNGVPIFYSLGNFFFDDTKDMSYLWTTGYFVQLTFSDEKVQFQLFPYVQCREEAKVVLMDSEQKNFFEKDISEINKVIADDVLLEANYEKWLNKRYRHYISTAQTWAGRYYKAAYRRKLLPAGITNRNAMVLLNYIHCESHLDLMIKALQKYIEEK